MSEVKKAVINKLKTLKNAFGESCDVFSKTSFEVIPRMKEDRKFKGNHFEVEHNSLENLYIDLSQLIKFVYLCIKVK